MNIEEMCVKLWPVIPALRFGWNPFISVSLRRKLILASAVYFYDLSQFAQLLKNDVWEIFARRNLLTLLAKGRHNFGIIKTGVRRTDVNLRMKAYGRTLFYAR